MVTRRRFLLGSLGAGATLVPPLAWYATVYEPGDVEIVRQAVAIPHLPRRLDGLKAVQISDLHLNTAGNIDVQVKAIELVRALTADVVFVTGDLVDTVDAVPVVIELLKTLSPRLGVWAVPGNWDHAADAVSALRDGLPTVNGRVLVNESDQLEGGLWVVGVDDPVSGHDRLDTAAQDVPATAATVLLAHSPDIVSSRDFSTQPRLSIGIILAGHTHGGQVNLPGLNAAWVHPGLAGRFTKGFFQVHGSRMYVNRGIGMTTVPIRIAARPEITLFTFTRRD